MTYEELLEREPYSLEKAEKERIFRELLGDLTDYHRTHCEPYDQMYRLSEGPGIPLESTKQLPAVPVVMFKEEDFSSISRDETFKVLSSSGTSGQWPSRIRLDRLTAERQQRTLERIVSSFIGSERLPMLIIDSPNVLRDRREFSARGAGILGFSIFGSRRKYALNEHMELDFDGIEEFLREAPRGPVLVFGFTYMIWKYFYQPLRRSGRRLSLEQGFLIHGGGWKKMRQEAVSSDVFRSGLRDVCGIRQVRNYYGMAEQTGCISMECECGHLHVSSYSDIIIRNPVDFSVCRVGEEGVAEVLTPMAGSYPGHAILTEDKGILLGEDDCPCGRKGKYFLITGRVSHAEARGCSDTYEENGSGGGSGQVSRKLLAGAMEISSRPMAVFSEHVMQFLHALSEKICGLPRKETSEALRTLGFWLRYAHLQEMKEHFDGQGRMGLGISFHITPANVPFMYLYSCALGLLAGNSCRVRVSGRMEEESGRILGWIDELLAMDQYASMRGRISFLAYDRGDEQWNRQFSEECDVRLIWGGDETIHSIRRFPIKPSALEITFPDRISVAVLDMKAVEELSEEALDDLAYRFYNDTYSMDQNGCSCPRLVFWIRSHSREPHQISERFWDAVAKVAEKYSLTEAMASRKYGTLWKLGTSENHWESIRTWKNRLYVMTVSASWLRHRLMRDGRQSLEKELSELRFGSFQECYVDCVEELLQILTDRVQTVTCFGIQEDGLWEQAVDHGIRGVGRIVPVGHALWMDLNWDGKDILHMLSRKAGGLNGIF